MILNKAQASAPFAYRAKLMYTIDYFRLVLMVASMPSASSAFGSGQKYH